MAAVVQCPNIEINKQMCPCTEVDCPRHGICCECIRYHASSTQWPKTACMTGRKRPEDTMSLPIAVAVDCPNREVNMANCVCTNTECERHGYCCSCVRNHWKPDGEGKVACMRD